MRYLILLLVVILLIVGGVYYYFSRFTYQPESLQPERVPPPLEQVKKVPITREQVQQFFRKQPEISLTEEEVSALILKEVQEQLPGAVDSVVKAFRVRFTDAYFEMEAIVNLKKFPYQQLPGRYQKVTRMLVEKFGPVVPGNLYVKIRGKPIVEGNQIVLADDATVTIGKVEYPLSEFLRLTGERIDLTPRVSLADFPIQSISVQEGRLILRKTP